MLQKNFEFEVLVNGHSVKEYSHNGRVYLEGKRGTEYSLRLKNNCGRRILAIISVDGLSIVDGNPANNKSAGYIIKPYDSITVSGWRKDYSDVCKFYFSEKDDSYVAKIGEDKDNIGVIGARIFLEKEDSWEKDFLEKVKDLERNKQDKWPVPYQLWSTSPYWLGSGIYACSAESDKGTNLNLRCDAASLNYCSDISEQKICDHDLGTGWGSTKKEEVRDVEFKREENIDAEFILYYASRKALEKMGIDFRERPMYICPQAFPDKFCKPPKN